MNPTDTPLTDNSKETPHGAQEKISESSQIPSQENLQSNLRENPPGDSQENSPNPSQETPEISGNSSQETTQNDSLEIAQNSSQEATQNDSMETTQTSSQENQGNPSSEASEPPSPENSPEVRATALETTSTEATGSVKKIAAYTAIAATVILLIIYLGVSFYFRSHFLFHTTINGQDFSRQTVEDARTFFAGEAAAYKLKITESGGKTEDILGSDIQMVWEDNQELNHILKDQNAFAWPMEYFKEKSEEIDFEITYDKSALDKKVNSLNAVTAEPIPPQSAYPEFDGNSYVIKPEVYGTDLDSEKLLKAIQQSVVQLDEEIDLQEEGFYKTPEYTTESKELKEVCQTLNHYCQASITYDMDVPVVVDKSLISTWLSFDKDFHVTLDEAAVRNWVAEFGKKYDTLGTTRPLTTPTGKATEVSGGTYGWTIDEDTEFPALLNSIKNGEVLTKAPSCLQTAASHSPQDWGGTFLEVDLTAQHMWYLQNGAVVFESDVVTGKNSTITPPGVYTILEKLSPTVLVGNIDPETKEPEYRTPVTFWMRVTWSGIGFHDATWQPAFGGDVYLWNGSHGCINMPYYSAQELYSLIEVGIPVVIHY